MLFSRRSSDASFSRLRAVMTYTSTTGPLQLGSNPRALQLTWFTLIILGQTGIMVLLFTMFTSNTLVPRLPVLYNLLFITYLDTHVYLILLYTGEYMNPAIDSVTCLAQAALKHGLDAAFILSTFFLVFEVDYFGTSRNSVLIF
ncbi:hypothetical protein SISSUDRAFT_629641 [Sistotremastrum suecicum HHB10207 ss-3]|uniref:G-protein coupled receptors family 1 profile domain-containing protein n=1 Tax=Sistotremastrum suecicum HHB10207 ss-3 TaxID=1314776 RepID=A0A166EGQ8_9AGAM|nr:hypothetical protein SISSUDRAFT_629641 [Sistotremastrum suecicum HHB10207 ss-3]